LPRKTAKRAERGLGYEEALAELEKIVESLEAGRLPLEEAVRLFERGQDLLARCAAVLESARVKVETLKGERAVPSEKDGES